MAHVCRWGCGRCLEVGLDEFIQMTGGWTQEWANQESIWMVR